MNILFDLGHPAHFHLFKNTINELEHKSHQIWITAKPKDILLDLLDYSNLEYLQLGKSKNRILNHIQGVLSLRRLIKKHQIDIVIGVSAIAPQAAIGTKAKSIVLDDDDISATPVFAALSHHFANHVLSPQILEKERNRKKDIFYHSYHELAYLHPKRFRADKNILKEIGIENGQFFSVIRFSAFKAHHDINENGIGLKQAERIIHVLEQKGKVFISSEKELPSHLQKYQLQMHPNKFHDLLAYANILVCDSQTVASEAAVLGVPSVRINTFVGRISYLEELEHKYQLTFGFKPNEFGNAIDKIEQLLVSENTKQIFEERRREMRFDKIDVTAFMVWFVESYPESAKIMKENPEYQNRFK